MTITLKKEIEEKVEIDLPYYCGSHKLFYRVEDEEQYTEVILFDGSLGIRKYNGYLPMAIFEQPKASEAVFNNMYQKALSELTRQSFLESGISTKATEEQIKEKLYEDQEVCTLENIIE